METKRIYKVESINTENESAIIVCVCNDGFTTRYEVSCLNAEELAELENMTSNDLKHYINTCGSAAVKESYYNRNLTREEAIFMAGEYAVSQVEDLDCEPTGRMMYADDAHYGMDEYMAATQLNDGRWLKAYYYQPEDCDTDSVYWGIDHYEID